MSIYVNLSDQGEKLNLGSCIVNTQWPSTLSMDAATERLAMNPIALEHSPILLMVNSTSAMLIIAV